MSAPVRLVLAAGSAVALAFPTAVVLAIVDLYVTGHGGTSLRRPGLSWGPFVDLSPADVILLMVVVAGALAAFVATGIRAAPPDSRRHPHAG